MLSLPPDCLAVILRKCDEPTRDAVAAAAPQLQGMVDDARYDEYAALSRRPGRGTREILPARVELYQRGCLNPNRRAILQCMSRVRAKRGLPPEPRGPLREIYEKVARLHQAEEEDLTHRVHTSRGFYLGGGIASFWAASELVREGFGISFDTEKARGSEAVVYCEAPRKKNEANGWGVQVHFTRPIDPADFGWRVRSCLMEKGFAALRLSDIDWMYEGELAKGLPHGYGTLLRGSISCSGRFSSGAHQPSG